MSPTPDQQIYASSILRLVALAYLIVAPVACGDDSTGDAITDGATTDTSELQPEACACKGDCSPRLCDTITISCADPEFSTCDDASKVISKPADLQCMLMALRDRTPGKVAWHDGGPTIYDAVILFIFADGTVVRRKTGSGEACGYDGPDTYHNLQAPEHFEGCLAKTDPLDAFGCLSAAVVYPGLAECAPFVEMCSGA